MVDEILKHPMDNSSIGILICKGKSKVVAEYSLRGLRRPIGITEYELTHLLPDKFKESLPSPKELESAIKLEDLNDKS